MQLKKLTLQNFRSFSSKIIEFDQTTVIMGPNASGKTNILEAINLLATGKSFRAGVEEEMIKDKEDVGRVMCEVGGAEEVGLEIVLTRGLLNETKVQRKKFSINGNSKRFYDFVGTLRTVLFGPWDMDLVTGPPSLRRHFLDTVCSQVDREYRRSLLSYEKGVRNRNRLLLRIREGEAKRSQLLFWDQLLIKNGEYITRVRGEFIDFTNLTDQIDEEELSLEYDHSIISPARLQEYAEEEVAAGATLVGPHRDDFQFKISNLKFKIKEQRNLAVFGSRGEQRMGVLWLKLAELAFIEGKTGERPVLLLDDVFSELDHKHRDEVANTIGKQQTIVTTADPHTVENLPAGRQGGEKGKIIELTS